MSSFRPSKRAAPRGYIAGLGRGAAGFTTRSDIGSAAPPTGISSEGEPGVGGVGGVGGNAVTGVGGSGSRAAELRAAKMSQRKYQQQLQQQQQQQQQQQVQQPSPFGVAPKGYVAGSGRGAGFAGDDGNSTDGPTGLPNSSQNGNGNGNAVDNQYDDDDDEADAIYNAIDERMNAKHKKRKVGDSNSTINKNNNNKNNNNSLQQQSQSQKIGDQFRELKKQLATVTEDEWASIPDVGDYSLRYKQKRRQDVFTPISDTLLESRMKNNNDSTASNENSKAASTTQLAQSQMQTSGSGFQSVVTNMSGLAEARGTVLGMSLDRMSKDDSTGGASGTQTSIDPTGYLTSLSNATNMLSSSTTDIADINKARLLLKSVRDTNPKHGSGWIASARVEEAANKIHAARKLIQEGCEICSNDEDVWMEAARLHPPQMAKTIYASAIQHIPSSIQIFTKAAQLENNDDDKKAIIRKGLECNPTSVTLWKTIIELEKEEDDVKVLLSLAIEKIPSCVDIWLALAKLETYDNARKVLNQARKNIPTDKSIWIAAAKLEESQNHISMIDKIISKAVSSLSKHDVVISRDLWLKEAENAERASAPCTSASIVKYTIGIGVDVEDRQRTWADDANNALKRGAVATSRAILAHSLAVFPTKRTLWMSAVELERNHGDKQSLDEVLAAASERLPKQEIFWLVRAKEKWIGGDIEQARNILTKAFAANPNSEPVWLAAAKLEWETGEIHRARVLLQRARERASSDRVYMKSSLLEQECENFDDALTLIEDGLKKYPKFGKLYMMGGQICSQDLFSAFPDKKKENLDRARQFFKRGLESCPHNVILWILASRLEEKAPSLFIDSGNGGSRSGIGFTKARSILELGRLKNPKNPELWVEAIRLERRAGNEKLAVTLMARALQECPNSGPLLAENITTSPRAEQKAKSADAIKKCPDDPLVIIAVASLFASERKVDKARKWFHRGVILNKDLGDSWAKFYAFENDFGDADKQKRVKEQCITADPKHGEIWCSIMKDMKNRKKTAAEGLELVTAYLREHNKA
jgi:pre-mRNA-processing factor 6